MGTPSGGERAEPRYQHRGRKRDEEDAGIKGPCFTVRHHRERSWRVRPPGACEYQQIEQLCAE
jgi:hypothetical protein